MASEITAGDTVIGSVTGKKYTVIAVDGNKSWVRNQVTGADTIASSHLLSKVEPFFEKGKKYKRNVGGTNCCTWEVKEVVEVDGKPAAIISYECKADRGGMGPTYDIKFNFSGYIEKG